jgi:integrase
VKNYEFLFTRFNDAFGSRELESITSDEILSFLTKLTDGTKQTTQRNRYSSLKAFFNFIKNSIDPNILNPCDTPILRKIFKDHKPPPWPIIEKELMDEIILKEYINEKGIEPAQRIFPITYNAARVMVNKAGKLVGIHLRPHDLRRFCATYASRAGTPIEIVSKIILLHAHLSTQRYLGKISDTEALKWIENLYG